MGKNVLHYYYYYFKRSADLIYQLFNYLLFIILLKDEDDNLYHLIQDELTLLVVMDMGKHQRLVICDSQYYMS